MSASLTVNSVESIKIIPAVQLGLGRVCREIVIYLKDGSSVTLKLFADNEELKLEIE